MAKKVFISYSHKDESLRTSLEDHLAIMKRKQIISVWHDRKIIPGDDWKGVIDVNLEEADIVLFLISASFLASDYCFDIEVKKAMENMAIGKCQIVSIILKPCDWHDCDFSKYQAVPQDGKAITTWENEDSAWLDVVKGLKKLITEFVPKQELNISPKNIDVIRVSKLTEEWLQDTEITLSHRKVNSITLDDVFVVPDIEYEDDNSEDKISIKSAESILKTAGRYLISGEEQQGKTTLLKYIYKELLKTGRIPIYIDADKIKKSTIDVMLESEISIQYTGIDTTTFLADARRVLLIDNIDELSLNNKFRDVLLCSINKHFEDVITTCHSTFSYVHNEISALDDYTVVKLLSLGHKKREEIALRWLSLGQEESISDIELYSQCNEVKARLNTIIKRNIVPPKPIFVLMLLQLFEANTQLNLELTSYGHCYQQLIYKAFDNANISKGEFDKYLNVLSEFAWCIFTKDRSPNDNEVELFFKEYNKTYLPVSQHEVMSKLLSHSILQPKDFCIGFKYPYIYYFFAAKKIAESYRDSEEIRGKTKIILEQLHREDFANILIFITHHTKDSWVLNEIKSVLASLFVDQKVASLEKDQLAFMENFMKRIPEIVLEQREVQEERDAHNENLDRIDRETESDEGEPVDIFSNINRTFKGMEVAGQIIRNRHASLTTDGLFDLASTGVSAGLRFLDYFITISDAATNEIVKLIANHLSEKPNLTDDQIERDAEMAYMQLTYGVINGVIKKIASAVGSKEALDIYRLLEEKSGTPAASLIKQAIELQFNKSISIKSVRECANKLRNNSVCTRILKEMVIQHIYMFPVEYKEKQQLSALLGISVRRQRLMDAKKSGKGSM